MEKMGLNEIREAFLSFYEGKGHYRKGSFSLVPEKDKSLLLINSGMAPLKPYFAGLETPPKKRMTTCQKCIRTGDIENVGLTARHGTFFEMLGNFSFGDYFKKETISWGWEFITKVLKMPEDKLWVTIYEDDDEAFDIWKNLIGIPEERIVRLGKDDNFWEIGTGPCGPCSEIYFDRGEVFSCGHDDCKPGCDCDRYVEFWNHVFTQFSKEEDGSYSNLAHPNIDTGMGLERIACIMQGVNSIFDIDTIQYILAGVCELANIEYGNGSKKTDVSIRIITDHLRSITFMIADGILPSNEGRGYVLRRLLRRAARHGKLLNIEGKFLSNLADRVITVSGKAYPELTQKAEYIKTIIDREEEKFRSTIDQGNHIIQGYVNELKAEGKSVLSGEKVFKLYDTYGFPLELTEEILAENGCTADVDGFKEHMNIQIETARAARKSVEAGWDEENLSFAEISETIFNGYEKLADDATILNIITKDGSPIDIASAGSTVSVILNQTVFYPEGGGQIYDTGKIFTDNAEASVLEVKKIQGKILHKLKITSGTFKTNENVKLQVDVIRRHDIAKNHTATHILQKALKMVVGEHIQQAGSSVNDKGLRFDFSHYEAVSEEQLHKIEELVNEQISMFAPVVIENMSKDDALKKGAMALFGEKYGDTVRVVSVGDFSVELCGGTHLENAGLVGAFKIVSESGVAAGVRRIEAITGSCILSELNSAKETLKNIASTLKTNQNAIEAKLTSTVEELRLVKAEMDELKQKSIANSLNSLLENAETVGDVKLLAQRFEDYDVNDLKKLCDDIKASNEGYIMVFATTAGGKLNFVVSICDDLLDKGYHAGKMVKEIAAVCDGSGGGKANMAQAGAKDFTKIDAAFDMAKKLILQ